jgi:tetratricopeptide (TPR) repeat protein
LIHDLQSLNRAMPPSVPKKIDKYEILGVVARGGMGVVYKALDRTLERSVAIKMVTGSGDEQHQSLKRFYREAQFTASLRHPNIVTVYDLGEFQGTPYLVMEYLPGRSLQSLLDDQAMTVQEKVRCIRQVCEGLHYAHTRQPAIIHRDVKPANIMVLDDDTVKIIDFGIARLGQTRNTRTGFVMGTYQYMSPEQVRNQEIDGRSDIFSTGVVLFHLLTHRLPFEGTNVSQTLDLIMNSPAPPLSRLLRDYPRQLDAVVARALAKRREERYQSADEFAFELAQVEAELKRGGFGRHLVEAERLYHQGELERAKLELGRVLEVDSHHREAGELMARIQRGAVMQQRQKRALNLRLHAEEALNLNRVSEAFNLIEQALRLDRDNSELRTFREKILLKEKVNQSLSRAERAVAANRFEEAWQAVEDALRSDPESVRAKSFRLMIEAKLSQSRSVRVETADDFVRPKKTRTTASLRKRASDSKRVISPIASPRFRESAFDEPDPVWTDEVFDSLKPAGISSSAAQFTEAAQRSVDNVYSASFELRGSDARREQVPPHGRQHFAGEEEPAADLSSRQHEATRHDLADGQDPTRMRDEAPPRRSEAWSYESLQVLEGRLAVFIGPLAKVVVRKAALHARSTGDLLELLAASIKQRKDRQAFVEQNAAWPEGLGSPASRWVEEPASAPVTVEKRGVLLHSAEIDRASRLLAQYIGPLAGVLTKKASKQASSTYEFYVLLSKHIKNPAERMRFLQDSGQKAGSERS